MHKQQLQIFCPNTEMHTIIVTIVTKWNRTCLQLVSAVKKKRYALACKKMGHRTTLYIVNALLQQSCLTGRQQAAVVDQKCTESYSVLIIMPFDPIDVVSQCIVCCLATEQASLVQTAASNSFIIHWQWRQVSNMPCAFSLTSYLFFYYKCLTKSSLLLILTVLNSP